MGKRLTTRDINLPDAQISGSASTAVPAERFRDDNAWQVFVSYRRPKRDETGAFVGSKASLEVARWLKSELETKEIEGNTGELVNLRVFVDEDEPSHSNWRDKLIPTLQYSRAIIVILDRAALKRKQGIDYLYEELELVASNPKRTPILLQLDTVSRDALVTQPKFSKWEQVQALPCYWDAWKNESRDERTANLIRLIAQVRESIRNLGSVRLAQQVEEMRQALESETQARKAETQARKKAMRRAIAATVAAICATIAAASAIYYLRDSRKQAANFNSARHGAQNVLASLDEKVFRNREAMGNIGMLEPITLAAVEYFQHLPANVTDSETEEAHVEALLNQAQVAASIGSFDQSARLVGQARAKLSTRPATVPSQPDLRHWLISRLKDYAQSPWYLLGQKDVATIPPAARYQYELRIAIMDAQRNFLQRNYDEAVQVLRRQCSKIGQNDRAEQKSARVRESEALCFYMLAGFEAIGGDIEKAVAAQTTGENIDPNISQELGSLFPNPQLQSILQSITLATIGTADPARVVELAKQDLKFSKLQDDLTSNTGVVRAKAYTLHLLSLTIARTGKLETALQVSHEAEAKYRLLLQSEPHNPALHDDLMDILLGRFNNTVGVVPTSQSIEELQTIDAYCSAHELDFEKSRLAKHRNSVLSAWGFLARSSHDEKAMNLAVAKLLEALPLQGTAATPSRAPAYIGEEWDLAELRMSLAGILSEESRESESFDYLNVDLPLWDGFVSKIETGAVDAAENMQLLVRVGQASRYSRIRAFVQQKRTDKRDAILWFRRAILCCRTEASTQNIDPESRRRARREIVELTSYLAQTYEELNDFKSARDAILPVLALIHEGIGNDRAGLITGANLYIAFACADMGLSGLKTAASRESIAEAFKRVEKLRTDFASDEAAKEVVARFDHLVEVLKQ